MRLDHFKRDAFERKPEPGTNVCGVLVHCYPGRAEDVRSRIGALAGAEVHHATDDGRLIVVIEDTAEIWASETLARISGLPGVVAAALAYHHCGTEDHVEEADHEAQQA
ncbi:MAG: chaperone NapD [Rhodospirillales bacterium]|nr:chaperone NapD [Rhodospirillales bacterium]